MAESLLAAECRRLRPDVGWSPPLSPAVETNGSPRELIERAFAGPEPIEPFLRAAAAEGGVLLLVNDPDRATDTVSALAAVFSAMDRVAPILRPTCLVAAGSHPLPSPEIRRAFEETALGAYRARLRAVAWHDARDAAALAPIGAFRLNRAWSEHRFALPIGSVEPHYFAGFTGAHKTATIGAMAYDDIQANHEGALSPLSRILTLEGNPVYEGVRRALIELESAGKRVYAINQVLSGSRIVACFAGDPLYSLHEAVGVARSFCVATVPEPVDAAVLRPEGPLAQTLYQADKALQNNHLAVRDGGGVALVAPLSRGIGPPRFLEQLQRCSTLERVLESIRTEGYRLGDHKAANLRRLTDPSGRRLRIALVSDGVSDAYARTAGMRRFDTLGDCLTWIAPAGTRTGLVVEDAANITVAPATARLP